VRALRAFAPGNVPRLEQATVNKEVLCFALGISFVGAILSGFLPAWKFSGTTPNDALSRVAVLRPPRQDSAVYVVVW